MSDILVLIYLFLAGAGVGSFLCVAVDRLHDRRNLRGRSRCDKCGHRLGAVELMPIVGWIMLRGRCKKCRQRIGFEPLLAELAVASFFTTSYLFWPNGEVGNVIQVILFVLWLIILSGLIFLLIYDAKYQLLPNRVMYPILIVAAIFWLVYSVIGEQNIYSILLNLGYAMLPIAGVYGLIFAISRGKMVGLGDVKLGVIIGFLLPWQGGVVVLFLANVLAMLTLLPFLLRKKLKPADHIPLGPFLILSTIAVFFMMKFLVDFF